MLKPRTLKVLALILVGYGLAALLATLFPDSHAGLLLVGPLLSVYAFHKLGIPGLLEHDGLCGWGWCSPTVPGWILAGAVWLAAAWLIAWGVGSLTARLAKR